MKSDLTMYNAANLSVIPRFVTDLPVIMFQLITCSGQFSKAIVITLSQDIKAEERQLFLNNI